MRRNDASLSCVLDGRTSETQPGSTGQTRYRRTFQQERVGGRHGTSGQCRARIHPAPNGRRCSPARSLRATQGVRLTLRRKQTTHTAAVGLRVLRALSVLLAADAWRITGESDRLLSSHSSRHDDRGGSRDEGGGQAALAPRRSWWRQTTMPGVERLRRVRSSDGAAVARA